MRSTLFRVAAVAVAVGLYAGSAQAANVSFTGSFATDDAVQLFNFSVGAPSSVTLRTYSYAGGVQANGNVVSAGGFDPILALFNSTGHLITQNDDGGAATCRPIRLRARTSTHSSSRRWRPVTTPCRSWSTTISPTVRTWRMDSGGTDKGNFTSTYNCSAALSVTSATQSNESMGVRYPERRATPSSWIASGQSARATYRPCQSRPRCRCWRAHLPGSASSAIAAAAPDGEGGASVSRAHRLYAAGRAWITGSPAVIDLCMSRRAFAGKALR